MADARIRTASSQDVPGIVALQRACFPPPFPEELLWKPNHIESHLTLFPQGQFVAESPQGEIIASCTNMLVSDETWQAHLPWEETTGGLALPKHAPQSQTLYGIDISVHPDHRRQGIAKALYQARFALVQTLGLSRYGTVCRIPGFQSSPYQDPAEYVQAVNSQTMTDPTLSPLLKMGLTLTGVIKNYMEDEESADTGAVLEWRP